MVSLSVFTTVILVCPAVLQQIPSTPSSTTSSSITTGSTSNQASTISSGSLATALSSTPIVTSNSPTSTLSGLQPGMTPPPSVTTATAPFVLVPIHTTLSVNIFPPHLHTLEGYIPTYEAHPDGSLVTTLFENKVDSSYIELMAVGVYLTIFSYTLWKSFSYLRRAGPRARSVFAVLCASQLLGLTAVTSVSVGFFDSDADCQAINLVASISGEVSYGLIITGILGFKIYRILERPRWLLGLFLLLQSVSLGLFIVDLPQMGQSRSFTGECSPTRELTYIPYSMIVMFVEITLITACFMYAIHRTTKRWNTATLPSDRSSSVHWWRRPSLAPFIGRNFEMDVDEPRGFSDTPSIRSGIGNRMHRILHRARLWFMSNRADSITTKRKMSDAVEAQGSARSNSQRSGSSRSHRFTRMAEDLSGQQSPPHEQISAPTDAGIRSPSTVPSVRGRTPSSVGVDGIFISSEKAPSLVVAVPERNATPGPLPLESDQARARPRPRANGGLGFDPLTRLSAVRVIPTRFIQSSRTIFKRVLRDELMSTAAISVVLLLSTLASFLGTWAGRQIIGRSLVLDGGWAFSSMLVLRSFGGVIRRAERSALLREHWENIGSNRAGTFDPTRRIPHDALSSLIFANPEELAELEASASAADIRWREPFQNQNAAADIEAWRREPRYSMATSATTPSRIIPGVGRMNFDDGEVSPKSQAFALNRGPIQSKGGRAPHQQPGNQPPKTTKISPPSLSSFSSYWASKSASTDAALDALRRASVVPSLSTLHRSHESKDELGVHWSALEQQLHLQERDISEKEQEQEVERGLHHGYMIRGDGEEEEDEDVTPMPAARMPVPQTIPPLAPGLATMSASGVARPRPSILRRGRTGSQRDTILSDSSNTEAAATEPVPIISSTYSFTSSSSRPPSMYRDLLDRRHSRTLSAPNLAPNPSRTGRIPIMVPPPPPNPTPSSSLNSRKSSSNPAPGLGLGLDPGRSDLE